MNAPTRYCLILLILFLIPGEGRGQSVQSPQPKQPPREQNNPFIISARAHYGFIIPHSRAIKELSWSNPRGIETEFVWHLMKKDVWDYCYCYPRTGFSVFWINFDNPAILGHSLAVYPFIEPYIRAEKKLNISFRFGIGPAFMNRIYHPETNPDNFFYSTHLSFIAMLNAGLNYRFTDRFTTRLAFNYNHISNGGINEPNVGINFPTLNIGADYSFSPAGFPEQSRDPDQVLYPKKNWIDLYLPLSAKNAEKGEEQRYPVFGAGILYNRLVSRIIALSAGTEWISDYSVKEKIRRLNAMDDNGKLIDHNRAAALLGVNFLFGKFTFSHQWGIYYYEPWPARNRAYQRYGLTYRVYKDFYTGISIKSHGHVADLMDLRFGILF